MTVIAPTITTDSPAVYKEHLEEFLNFAPRIQIDITDGQFAPSRTLNLNQLYWPAADQRQTAIDLHLMMVNPALWIDQLVSLGPDKVIIHAESQLSLDRRLAMLNHLRRFGIQVGVALLPATKPEDAVELIQAADSVLIFGGKLGYQGGQADLEQLRKIPAIRRLNSAATIEWDGGANLTNVRQIAQAGVEQINVGSAISSAANPQAAYDELTAIVTNQGDDK